MKQSLYETQTYIGGLSEEVDPDDMIVKDLQARIPS